MKGLITPDCSDFWWEQWLYRNSLREPQMQVNPLTTKVNHGLSSQRGGSTAPERNTGAFEEALKKAQASPAALPVAQETSATVPTTAGRPTASMSEGFFAR